MSMNDEHEQRHTSGSDFGQTTCDNGLWAYGVIAAETPGPSAPLGTAHRVDLPSCQGVKLRSSAVAALMPIFKFARTNNCYIHFCITNIGAPIRSSAQ
jgi:hypothetical protein